ncbi:hypothetical protein OROHE_001501 [Orobanche hederae]
MSAYCGSNNEATVGEGDTHGKDKVIDLEAHHPSKTTSPKQKRKLRSKLRRRMKIAVLKEISTRPDVVEN